MFRTLVIRFVVRVFGITPMDVMYPFVPSGSNNDTFHINVEQSRRHYLSLDGTTCTFCGSTTDQCHCW
jgi:hypothetical protein